MSLTQKRMTYKPFEYQKAYEFWEKQQNAHWLPSRIGMAKDVTDWKYELTEGERQVVGQILKSFTQAETNINDYWSQKVSKWFPKPEICLMTSAFASTEGIHTVAYAQLNDTLGLDDYEAFMEDPTAMAKLDRLHNVKGNSKSDIARSLAIFSACTEGVSLFSSFAILISFSRFNLMRGVETAINYSIREESLHSEAGCWLYNTLIDENPEILTPEFKEEIKDAFRLTVKLEDDFIDNVFSLGDVRGLNSTDIKVFIRARANAKLHDLRLPALWKKLDKDALERMSWFDDIDLASTDFFANKVTDYSKCNFTIDNLFPIELILSDIK